MLYLNVLLAFPKCKRVHESVWKKARENQNKNLKEAQVPVNLQILYSVLDCWVLRPNDSYSADVYIFLQKAKKKKGNYPEEKNNSKVLLLWCIILLFKPNSEVSKKLVIWTSQSKTWWLALSPAIDWTEKNHTVTFLLLLWWDRPETFIWALLWSEHLIELPGLFIIQVRHLHLEELHIPLDFWPFFLAWHLV